jgi:hypothetical protein
MRDPTVAAERRDQMAIHVAPYVHAKLAVIEQKVDTTAELEVRITQAELAERATREIEEAFREWPTIEHEPADISATPSDPPLSPPELENPQRESARVDGGLKNDDRVTRLQPRHRAPRPHGPWGA